MERKIEGLILKKNGYGDRHIISDLLLRSGKKVTVTFYGGRGGGTKKKAGTIEVGQLLSIELNHNNRVGDVYSAKEWKPKWIYLKIRENHKAFYVTCSFLEIIMKLCHKVDLKDKNLHYDNNDEGLFRVLSNGVFYLEESLTKKIECHPNTHIFYFLSKLLVELGIYPIREECCLSREKINLDKKVVLLSDQGGFAILELAKEIGRSEESTLLWQYLGEIWATPYKHLNFEFLVPKEVTMLVLDYLCYQLGLNKADFKSLSLVL